MEQGLLDQGLVLMLVGMGTVFVFLTLLVGATTLMSSLTARFIPAQPTATDVSEEEVAAIAAAIELHRRR